MAHAKLKKLNSEIRERFGKGFIRLSLSPWGALTFFVKNRNGSIHVGINYRRLNKLIVKNLYPISRNDYLFEHLQA